MSDNVMAGGRFAAPVRDGDAVTRRKGPGAANIHALLTHLAQQGFVLAPRPLGSTADGEREVLTYLPGASADPPLPAAVRSEKALRSAARAVRALHDASQGFVSPQPGAWARQEVVLPAEIDCIGHGDLAPWNLLFNGDQVTAIIDFDAAGPSNRAYDLAFPDDLSCSGDRQGEVWNPASGMWFGCPIRAAGGRCRRPRSGWTTYPGR